MVHLELNTYQMKREILSFSHKISKSLPKPERKFIADMNLWYARFWELPVY